MNAITWDNPPDYAAFRAAIEPELAEKRPRVPDEDDMGGFLNPQPQVKPKTLRAYKRRRTNYGERLDPGETW